MIPVPRQLHRVTLARHDVADDPNAGHPRDVADDERQLEIHLDQGFLHPLDMLCRGLDQGLSMPNIGAQGNDRLTRTKAAAQEHDGVEVT